MRFSDQIVRGGQHGGQRAAPIVKRAVFAELINQNRAKLRGRAVKRNQIVTLAYEKAALRIEAEGRALGAGGIGEVIRVMNSTSRVTVSGRIAADGTVVVEQI